MKKVKFLLGALLLMIVAAACNDKYDTPPMVVPVAQHTPNMTLLEFKTKYWQDGRNFIDTCKEDIIIHGYVSGTDAAGNIYKHMYIQDETAGLGISIDANSLYNTYREGQEVVINMKDFFIGKYNGEYLLGKPEWYAAQSAWEAGRMTLDMFQQHAELNGLPNLEKVVPVVTKITDFSGKSDAETQIKYQGQLVKFENVKWQEADGEVTFSEASASSTRHIVDAEGNTLDVTNSNYANFRASMLPLGEGDVVGILYLTGDSSWKLYLRDETDCIGFLNDTKGTLKDPYSVQEAIAARGNNKEGWIKGFIVGAVAPEVQTISSSADIEFKAPTTLDNTLVIADAANEQDITKLIVVSLPQNSQFRKDASLKNYPELLGTSALIKGKIDQYMGITGIVGNSGSRDEYKLSIATGGVTQLEETFDSALPTDWLNIQVKGDKAWYQTSFDNNGYAAMTGYKGTAPFESWLITPAIDIKNAPNKTFSFMSQVNGYGSTTTKFRVFLLSSSDPATAEKIELNPKLPTAPASGYSGFVSSGDLDLSEYSGTYYIGFVYEATSEANYATWTLDDVKFGMGKVVSNTRADLETMNEGKETSTFQAQMTSKKGWVATNAALLRGGASDANPVFTFIGDADTYAINLNGKVNSTGTLVSPTISGGCTDIFFKYGHALTESGIHFKVHILMNGQIVKTFSFDETQTTAKTAYEGGCHVDLKGDFVIMFEAVSFTQSSSNKDRVAIWDIEWTPNE
ncbi:MAG: choice-of-anchor J domain-containing protein [Muribaculaceae bacterium]|nr:choice-of-anchor J domain-containing protein [Muribaculaceae bacterium]